MYDSSLISKHRWIKCVGLLTRRVPFGMLDMLQKLTKLDKPINIYPFQRGLNSAGFSFFLLLVEAGAVSVMVDFRILKMMKSCVSSFYALRSAALPHCSCRRHQSREWVLDEEQEGGKRPVRLVRPTNRLQYVGPILGYVQHSQIQVVRSVCGVPVPSK